MSHWQIVCYMYLQKYAHLPQVNPRSEDIVVLSQLYQRVLKPHIDKGMSWVCYCYLRLYIMQYIYPVYKYGQWG